MPKSMVSTTHGLVVVSRTFLMRLKRTLAEFVTGRVCDTHVGCRKILSGRQFLPGFLLNVEAEPLN